MTAKIERNAIVYCQGAFNTPNGKTAHGLVRRSERYDIVAVIDSNHTDKDAGQILDGKRADIPVVADLRSAIAQSESIGKPATHFVIGLAPDGGKLPNSAREAIREAIKNELSVDSGLHDFLTEDREFPALAREYGVNLRDIRKPPPRSQLHFFSGKIEDVTSMRIAVLGTDSAIGKRTTAWMLVDALRDAGLKAALIGTGQTAWMQGARYSIILDSLINDFVSGEIEHAAWSAWKDLEPDVLVLEGQGSLMNPAYPGGFEILAAGRPDFVILQHATRRAEYDGFPGYPLHPLKKQIEAIELISERPVAAITLNHEGMKKSEIAWEAEKIRKETGLPCVDVLVQGGASLVDALRERLPYGEKENHE